MGKSLFDLMFIIFSFGFEAKILMNTFY